MNHHDKTKSLKVSLSGIFSTSLFCLIFCLNVSFINAQTINIDGAAGGKRFDGIGAVSGGGATSVLLKDYPEPQRSQILDFLFKPKFGASMSAFFVEIPGDGNSTQGTEPSHMHLKDDENYSRGYEWWLMSEAKKRNAAITLDGTAWSSPGWVGNNNYWSQDMCDYYVKWVKGLKNVYGLELDAIGCRNEKGVNTDFAKMLRSTLNKNGLSKVKIHGFDNWQRDKFDWVRNMKTDTVLRGAVDVLGNHTLATMPTPSDVLALSEEWGKPIWNTEEHVYKEGFDCEISLVQAFNKNFLESGATKIVNWYLVASVYGIEPFPITPGSMIAREPWSGNYATREVLWGYAHYGQFTEVGWQYLNGACGKLNDGGTYVTLKSPKNDYSIIIETKDASMSQQVDFVISDDLSKNKLCVWRSNASEQFVQLDDIAPVNGVLTITLDPKSIYSISTTSGQRKGTFGNIPESKPFPFPYYENFESYQDPKSWGYLPHYTADIAGVFEIAERPDKKGKCLRQVIGEKAQSWAPEWRPYTVLGDQNWTDYEISADIYLDNGGMAGLMGRLNSTGQGYGSNPKGYYMGMNEDGACTLYLETQKQDSSSVQLATGIAKNAADKQWHNLKLQFQGSRITGFVDNVQVLTATDATFPKGMAGMITGGEKDARNTAYFDNLIIKPIGAPTPEPTKFIQDVNPIYPFGMNLINNLSR